MLRQRPLTIVPLLVALSFTSCQNTQPIGKGGSDNPINAAQSSPSDLYLSSAAPSPAPCTAPTPDANHKIVLTAPCDGAKVAQRSFVEGAVADPNAEVSVIIHPMETADYWVQPNVTVRDGGKWRVLCYFGELESQQSGRHFELVAIIMNAKGQLQEGQLFHNWPPGQLRSQVIEVVQE